jgi:hypothetical protein
MRNPHKISILPLIAKLEQSQGRFQKFTSSTPLIRHVWIMKNGLLLYLKFVIPYSLSVALTLLIHALQNVIL